MPVENVSKYDAPSREQRLEILRERDGWKCYICNTPFDDKSEITLDHYVPLARGGSWDIENLRLASRRCNQMKADLMPNPDGSIPKRNPSTFRRRSEKRADRAEFCETCFSGRILLYDEECPDCGSGPQPAAAPTAYQLRPKECPHAGPWHCWMCFLGMVPREPAFTSVLDAEDVKW